MSYKLQVAIRVASGFDQSTLKRFVQDDEYVAERDVESAARYVLRQNQKVEEVVICEVGIRASDGRPEEMLTETTRYTEEDIS